MIVDENENLSNRPPPETLWNRYLRWHQTYFLKGLGWSIPVGITLWIGSLILGIADRSFGPVTRALVRLFMPKALLVGPFTDGHIPGLSLLILLLCLTMIGALVSWRWGKFILRWFDAVIVRIPVLGFVYSRARQVSDLFANGQTSAFQRVVLIPYPTRDFNTIAFVMGEIGIKSKITGKTETFLRVVVPNPPSGIHGVPLIAASLVMETDMPVAEGLQYYGSLGMVAPNTITAG